MFLLGGRGEHTHWQPTEQAGDLRSVSWVGLGLGCGEFGLGFVRNERNSDLDSRFYSWLGTSNIVVDGIASVHYWDAVLQTGTGRSLHIGLVVSFQGTVIVWFVCRRGVYYGCC